ncbi:MAG: ribonuclease HII [Corynebacterium sp.]|nr:ribonuclease HII [Corynebacterium sp.]
MTSRPSKAQTALDLGHFSAGDPVVALLEGHPDSGFVDVETVLHLNGYEAIAGVDEAGRGACCGPITIAACVLPDILPAELALLNDSKKLTAKQRAKLFPQICKNACSYAIVHFSAEDVDIRGLQFCNVQGMIDAVAQLDPQPDYVLHDQMSGVSFSQPATSVVRGDARVRTIAAASILAKHARDSLMVQLDEQYPGYGLAKHKGYGVKNHIDAVRRLGGSPEHRYSYSNVQRAHEQWLSQASPNPAGEAEYERRRSRKL